MRSAAVLCLIALLAACQRSDKRLATATVDTVGGHIPSITSAGPTAWADTATGWRLVLAGMIGSASGTPGELIDPQSVAVDDAGRLYVTDDKPTIIKVYGADGRFLHTIGREGEGPGEFKAAFLATHGGRLVVHDPSLSRTSVFDTSGTFIRSWNSACCYYGAAGVDRNGWIYVLTMATPDQHRMANYLRYTLDGALLDTIFIPVAGPIRSWTLRRGEQSVMSTIVPGAPRTVWTLDPDGGVLYGYSADYRIVSSATGHDSARVFGRAWTPAPVSSERRHAMVESRIAQIGKMFPEASLRKAFHESEIPAIAPAFAAIAVDQAGNRWVQVDNDGDSTTTHFDVFDAGGRYLGPVILDRPAAHSDATAWGRNDVYLPAEAEDGTPRIAHYRIDRRVKVR